MDCPCGSGVVLESCCKPVIDGAVQARTAEQLMRSRFTAYAQKSIGYILGSYAPESRTNVTTAGLQEWADKTSFERLEILSREAGGVSDDEGWVEFKAHYSQDGIPGMLYEKSRFKRINGRWFYVDGTYLNRPPEGGAPKIGRNEPCLCGSGKKYKKCCGR